jgi:hypothetical protein
MNYHFTNWDYLTAKRARCGKTPPLFLLAGASSDERKVTERRSQQSKFQRDFIGQRYRNLNQANWNRNARI